MTEKRHIERMINDEWARNLLDKIDVLHYKIDILLIESLEEHDIKVQLEKQLVQEIRALQAAFFNKYYVHPLVTYTRYGEELCRNTQMLRGKTNTIQSLLLDISMRSSQNIKHSRKFKYLKGDIEKAKEIGCQFIDRTEEGNQDKQHIELIFRNKDDMQILIQMEECLDKEGDNLFHRARYNKPLFQKDYSKEFFILMKSIEDKYYVDEDIDWWNRISEAWYSFSSAAEFHRKVIKEQKYRGGRKRLPKKLAEKANWLNLIWVE